MRILVMSGPNLNLLGTREPDVYGADTLEDIHRRLAAIAASQGFALDFFQSNHEGDLIDRLHATQGSEQGVVFNPGAFTHYSYALRDAVSAITAPVVEVHLSNISARESFRRESVIAPACIGQVSGFGAASYEVGLGALVEALRT